MNPRYRGFTAKLDELKSKYPDIQPENLKGKTAEIQITSVVMHAWSQVEHDVIYKNPLGIPINETITRMLDGINGQSITSEILLEELQRSIEQMKSLMNHITKSPGELRDILKAAYLHSNMGLEWEISDIQSLLR